MEQSQNVHQSSWSLLTSIAFKLDARFDFRQPDLGPVYSIDGLKLDKTVAGGRWRRNGFCLKLHPTHHPETHSLDQCPTAVFTERSGDGVKFVIRSYRWQTSPLLWGPVSSILSRRSFTPVSPGDTRDLIVRVDSYDQGFDREEKKEMGTRTPLLGPSLQFKIRRRDFITANGSEGGCYIYIYI